jgi:hypothetical protein
MTRRRAGRMSSSDAAEDKTGYTPMDKRHQRTHARTIAARNCISTLAYSTTMQIGRMPSRYASAPTAMVDGLCEGRSSMEVDC